MRIGIGYDAHRLTEGRPLVLGGCMIPFEKGLLGHSDADVLTHAIIDAILGGAALGDIGRHFPDTDRRYENISSLHMLKEVRNLIDKASLSVGNIDGIIVAQAPKLADFLPHMAKNIACALGVADGVVNVKATTEEGMGFTGTGLGIAAHAAALLVYKEKG